MVPRRRRDLAMKIAELIDAIPLKPRGHVDEILARDLAAAAAKPIESLAQLTALNNLVARACRLACLIAEEVSS